MQTTPSPKPAAEIGTTATLLAIHTRHGTDYCLHAHYDKAAEHLAAYVREYWHEVSGMVADGLMGSIVIPEEAPEDNDEAVSMYFDAHPDEHYDMEPVEIQP